MSANDKQVGGAHYGAAGGIQHWDLLYNVLPDVFHGYFMGCASKYVGRSRKKNGRQDVEKALHFVEKYRELLDGPPPKQFQSMAELLDYVTQYGKDNQLTPTEHRLTLMLLSRAPEDRRQVLDIVVKELQAILGGAGVHG